MRRYPTSKVRSRDCEKIPPHPNSGAGAVRRYPTSKVREIPVRQEVLREGIRGQTDRNHSHRKLTSLLTWTTALSNSMKL